MRKSAFLHLLLLLFPFSSAKGQAPETGSVLQQLEGLALQQAESPLSKLPPPGPPAPAKPEGIGIAHSGDPFDIPDFTPPEIARLIKEAGGTHYRPHLTLKEALPELSPQDMDRLRKAKDDPALMESMIQELSRNGPWARMDSFVHAFHKEGIQLVLVVGCGYKKEMPLYTSEYGEKQEVSPDRIGRDLYLTLVRWLAGAAVRRYGDRVAVWQIENEINAAWTVARLSKWRVSEKSWGDLKFIKSLLTTLAEAVHSEGRRQGRDLKTVHNFVPDIPWAPWKRWPLYRLKYTLKEKPRMETLAQKNVLDIVGIDLYPNYYVGKPLRAKGAAKQVREAQSVAKGRPVWILEIGYARAPRIRGFSEKSQAEYFRKSFDSAYKAGASLVFAFGWFWNPLGWYNSKGKPLPWWQPRAVEQYWSPLIVKKSPDGKKQIYFGKAWHEFREAAKRWLKK